MCLYIIPSCSPTQITCRVDNLISDTKTNGHIFSLGAREPVPNRSRPQLNAPANIYQPVPKRTRPQTNLSPRLSVIFTDIVSFRDLLLLFKRFQPFWETASRRM